MSFKVEIKNIGKLTDAELRMGRFTVFAGPNNTGKSFVSKLLYSLFESMNENYAETYINKLLQPVRDNLIKLMQRELPDDKESKLLLLLNEIKELESLARKADNFERLNEVCLSLRNRTENMRQTGIEVSPTSSEIFWKEYQDFHDSLNMMQETLDEFKTTPDQALGKAIVRSGMRNKIRQNLIQNFQVPSLSDLSRDENVSSKVDVENIGSFEFSNGETRFDTDVSGIKQLQQYSNVIYLESPVYWKLKNALEDLNPSLEFFGRRGRARLTGVPGYFYDLARALKFQYTGDMAFPDVYERLTGSNVIGGKLAISETGDLSFHENGLSFSLPVTAMGIANLGILALLIERKVLDEGSFLFIDEPEAHLHPAWQVFMAETLFELSRQGVSVVIATHSADILKWLEVHVKKNPDDEQLVALNRFSANGCAVDEDFETRIAEIKQELTKPFSDLYLEGL
ncbi:MAG: AAA family ATPase [Nitrospira sp.]|nr:AAA family ATPase [Nitrospira sp.]